MGLRDDIIKKCDEKHKDIQASLSRDFARTTDWISEQISDAAMSRYHTISLPVSKPVRLTMEDLNAHESYVAFRKTLEENGVRVKDIELVEKTVDINEAKRTRTEHIHFHVELDEDLWKDILFVRYGGQVALDQVTGAAPVQEPASENKPSP